MGSYSMSCGLSGLEVAQGQTCLVTIVREKPYQKGEWMSVLPPIRGCYDDYGNLRIDEADIALAAAFGIDTSFAPWEPLSENPIDDEKVWCLPMWIDAAVYDSLGELVRDFAERRGGTVGEDAEIYVAQSRVKIAPAIEKSDRFNEMMKEGQEDFLTFEMSNIFGYGDDVLFGFKERFVTAVRAGQSIDLLMEGYHRALILAMASRELRRPLLGQNGAYGPQHGGEKAMMQFAQTILDGAAARVREDEDEDDD